MKDCICILKKLMLGVILASLFLAGCKTEAPESQKTENVLLSAITISSNPDTTFYHVGDKLDLTGLEVTAIYSDGSKKILKSSEYEINHENGTVLNSNGEIKIVVTYKGKEAWFTVKVGENTENLVTMTGIYVSKQPDKLSYIEGELLDLTGLEISATYSNEIKKVISGWTANPGNGSKLTETGNKSITITYSSYETSFIVTVEPEPLKACNSFFWGTWVRMDNGHQYEVLEKKVFFNNEEYEISSSSENELSVSSLGTFKKESDSVIVNNNIPYFRNGGANLEYSLKLVGFTGSSSRAAGSSIAGIKGKAKSNKYTSFETESTSDSDGTITFTAPTKGDTQTVTILNGDDMVVVPGLTISNSGDYMGTVALVGKDDYNLKITGTISDNQKDDGYLYGNNAQEYNMVLTIKNISSNKCTSSVCTIKADDPGLNLSSTTTNLSAFTISTLEGGTTKTVDIKLSYSNMEEAYVDTGITVTIRNPDTKQEWLDYIPLRFFKGLIPITIAAKSTEKESEQAALNGFIIYPDGNNQFFSVANNGSKILFVPAFGSQKKYTMVFSGATVTSELSESTEMYYTVNPASSMQRKLDLTPKDNSVLEGYMEFGGNNHSEENAYDVESSFQAYLSAGEIDYYLITADGDEYYEPVAKSFCQVSYESEYGNLPGSIYILKDTALSEESLPVLEQKGKTFLGWYTDSSYTQKVEAGYTVNSSVTLYAKWEEADGFVFVEGGTFSMGSSSRQDNQKPVHSVTLSSFYMSPYETTQKLYKEVMETNPSCFSSSPAYRETQELRPVEYVSWYDTIYFCNRYSEIQGLTPCYKVNGTAEVTSWGYTPHNENSISGTITCDFTANGYRLPTEAEWEYAAKGGKNKDSNIWSGSDTDYYVAWCSDSDYKTHEVGKKRANSLGIYDMSGNVWEYCWDWYGSYSSSAQTNPTGASSGSSRVMRGGSWHDEYSYYSLVSYRDSRYPDSRSGILGFRLVRSAQ